MILIRLPLIAISLAGAVSFAGPIPLTTYVQNFNTLKTSGTTNTLIPNGWIYAEDTATADRYAAGNGSSALEDTYSFGATGSTERAFGLLRSGPTVFAEQAIGVQFWNLTGSVITEFLVEYTGEQWRLGESGKLLGPDRLDFSYSYNATNVTNGAWTDVNELDFVSPVSIGTVGALDGNAPENRQYVSFLITGLNLGIDECLYLKWTDYDVAGVDDGLAIDDFKVTVPEEMPPGAMLVTMFGLFAVASTFRRKSTRS